jgi:dinuclear metal center YbgI/SA1388 family protein
MDTVATLAGFLQEFAPLELAEEWDNVGLLLGDAGAAVRRVMTCLTVTPASVAEAVREGAQLIVSHHPVLFRPSQKWTSATAEGRMLLTLVQAGVAVYSPHTAFDNAKGGINDILAQRLGLAEIEILRPAQAARQCKIIVFVPDADLRKVSDAMFAAGAGQIGQYRECSFRSAGTGTFFASEATNPSVGQKGRREEVNEWRLEVLCPDARVERVVRAMRAAHSYEEPAFDVQPLRLLLSKEGAGRMGVLAPPLSLPQFATQVKEALGAAHVQVSAGSAQPVRRVALACGAAGEFVREAGQQGADVFLTGEMRFHDCLSAQAQQLHVVLAGHYATERCGIEELAKIIQARFPQLQVWPSRDECDPLASV